MPTDSRLRLRLPNGAEFEAAGDPEFIRSERTVFLNAQEDTGGVRPAGPGGMAAAAADWASIVESNGGNLQLRAKLKNGKTHKDACLVLLAAAQKLIHQTRPTAAQLARWLRASGYPVRRVDRAIAEALDKGELLASGSRRARRYELTGPGFLKACAIAGQLASLISGTAAGA